MKLIRLKIALVLSIGLVGLFLFYHSVKQKTIEQWNIESNLYKQGYLDGKEEVLDSLRSANHDSNE